MLHPLPSGFYPFWFWNDRLDEAEIRWQVGEMAAQGIKGFFIHSRQGLGQPYLSDTFFQMVAVAIDAAEQHGLTAHLYDEYPYPSGVAGGEVVLGSPEFYATALVQKTFDVSGGPLSLSLPRGKILNCVICPLIEGEPNWTREQDARTCVGMMLTENSYNEAVGLTPYNRKRYFASRPTPTLEIDLPAGPHRVFVSAQTVVEGHKYWGHFADVLNPDAVAAFLQLTHERYARRFGEKFGTTIPSIFVDETAPGWSARLPEAFRRKYGYDLPPLLPALQDAGHPAHLRVLENLSRLRLELFCEAFEEPVSRWCAAHGLRYLGEKPSLRLAQLRYMDIPGCDAGHAKAGAKPDLLGADIRTNARAAASAAYFYGKEGALCEAYHSLGWSATLQDAKLIAEGLLLHGVRFLVPHGFFYSAHALRKHDAPPSFFFQMPFWPLFGQLAARLDRLAGHLDSTWVDAQIVVVEPAAGLPTALDLAVYQTLQDLLMAQHLEFLLADTDILEAGQITEGQVRLRDLSVRVVIVPPMRVVEAPLEAWLAAFEQAGGTVVRLSLALNWEVLAARLRALAPSTLDLAVTAGNADEVHLTARRRGEHRLWMLLNTGAEPVELALEANAALREIPLDITLPAGLSRASDARYRRKLAPFESCLLTTEAVPKETAEPPHVSIPIRGPMRVTISHPNLLRLAEWQMTLRGENDGAGQTETVSAAPLANQLAQGRFRFAPTIAPFFGAAPHLHLPLLRLHYQAEFDSNYDGPVQLVMEPGSLRGQWRIQVNGHSLPEDQFALTPAHTRGSLGADITPLLRAGRNQLAVFLDTDERDGGLLNPLYLAGDFGVYQSGEPALPCLVSRPATGAFEAWEENGLPYYAGVVEYEAAVELPALPGGNALLADFDFGQPFESAAEASFNDGPWKPLLWSPRQVCLSPPEIKAGRNLVRLRVYTSLLRAFEGQWFDSAEHARRDVQPARPR
ncbi:MAG: hypothetical protein M3Y13_04160 [Armatimonadota bacterium]|nr:hypothetical protein [Armatimonadota bacterium]